MIHMKYQDLFSRKKNKTKLSSAAIVIGTLRVYKKKYIYIPFHYIRW